MSLDWLYRPVAWLIINIHEGLSYIFHPDSGAAWGLTILLLTVVVRIVIFPLFMKQLKSSKKMQELSPKMQEIRSKYKNDKQRQQQELQKVMQEGGANPLGGCLPLVVQLPIFYALFTVLRNIAQDNARWGFTQELVESASHATIFGAPIAARFLSSQQELANLGANVGAVRAVTLVAVLISATTTFLTVRQSMSRTLKQMPDSPMAQQQKIFVYLAPVFALFGLGFPLGVLIYWASSNTWTLIQQHFVYRRMPALAPGSAGAEKDSTQPAGPAANGEGRGLLGRKKSEPVEPPQPPPPPKVVRKQPVNRSRSKRSGNRKR